MTVNFRLFALLKLITVFATFFCNSSTVISQNITWTGNGDGSTWSNANNWSPTQVPNANNFVNIPSLSDISFTPSSDTIRISGLNIQDSSKVEFNFPLFVTGNFIVGESDNVDLITTDTARVTFNEYFEASGFFVQNNQGLAKLIFNANAKIRPAFAGIVYSIQQLHLIVNDGYRVIFPIIFEANDNGAGLFGGPNSLLNIEGAGNVAFAGGLRIGQYTIFTNNGNACYSGIFDCYTGNCTGNALTDPCVLIEPTIPFISGGKPVGNLNASLESILQNNLDPDSLETNVFQFLGDSVLIDIVVFENGYQDAVQALAAIGLVNRIDNGNTSRLISGYLPIDSLP